MKDKYLVVKFGDNDYYDIFDAMVRDFILFTQNPVKNLRFLDMYIDFTLHKYLDIDCIKNSISGMALGWTPKKPSAEQAYNYLKEQIKVEFDLTEEEVIDKYCITHDIGDTNKECIVYKYDEFTLTKIA